MTLARVITLAAERYPDAEAVVAPSTRYTYARWSERINRLARRLGELGLRRADHVLLLLKNREEYAAMYWACQSLGAIATPLNWRSSAAEIEYCATDAEAVAVVFEDASRDAICDRVMQKPACAGRPGVFGRARVVRADPGQQGSPDALVARGETGELIVSLDSPEAFAGYWCRPDADARALRGGWYFTGDLVHEDPEGDIYTVGRVDDMIISGGENIYPIEVEDVLLRHADVAEACVLGMPTSGWGRS